ncbi:MAG: hypothetical protein JSV30_04615 [Candidatus Omnitrophota bacterium]|nr:MAG: hypothetical protein JSV30_04615 [Candidatus Omnitrophota bacterium]
MNRFRHLKIIPVLLLLVTLSGCVTMWTYLKEEDEWKRRPFEARLPAGWVKYNAPGAILILTKDGLLLQQIQIVQHRIDTDKEFPISKKMIKEDMLVQEIAELVVNEMALDNERMMNFKILENKPVEISGIDGFKLTYSYKDGDFKRIKGIYCGFIFDKKFYSVEYIAAQQYYFDKDLRDFEWFVDNLQIVKK